METPYISVKDFGAKGDGKTDDTRAIQAAIDFAQKNSFSQYDVPGVYPRTWVYFGGNKTVFFPLGIYLLSAPLKVGSYFHFIGEKSVFVPVKSKTRKINGIEAVGWQAKVEGMQFLGFKTALQINNGNVNTGKVVVDDCDFMENDCGLLLYTKSSITSISSNRFIFNTIAVDIEEGDKVIFRECWIDAAKLSGVYPCQVINRGVLHFDKNLLVPNIPQEGTIEPAWINNYGTIYVDGVRQGGEPGSFTLVNNFTEAIITYPVTPNGVTITNSDCYGIYGNTYTYRAPAALRLIKLPNNIVLENLKGFVDAKVMDYSQQPGVRKSDFTKYKGQEVKIKMDHLQITPAKHSNGLDVPPELEKYMVK